MIKESRVFSAEYLPGILTSLDGEQDFREFQALKEQFDEQERISFVLSRVGLSRAKAQHYTPRAIKSLRPGNSVLVWQRSTFAFQAYFPVPQALRNQAEEKAAAKKESKKGKGRGGRARVKTHWTRSRSYKEKRTKLEALQWVVDWLWRTHNQGGEPRTCINYYAGSCVMAYSYSYTIYVIFYRNNCCCSDSTVF